MPEERKLVTIFFADVTGSTELGETLDPEDVRALMGRYYDHAQRVIASHSGTLEKFIGDAVMAVFGLPQAHGDDAERALAAAVALHAAVASDALLNGRLQLHVGVNTGEVVATSNPASGDFLVTGDAVNVAARLQQAANAGEILASERTATAAQAAFLFGRDRLIRSKGKNQRLRAFPVGAMRPERRRARPTFVGRQQDLQQLHLLRARALEERQPQLISIVAPAGTGKTRLVEEFLAQVDPANGFQVATARCPPYGQTLTYWPLRGLLGELLGGEVTPRAVADTFARAGDSPDDAGRLAQLVLATLGVDRDGNGDGAAARETIFNAWRLLVEALARQAPRIVVFENLHWASDSLLDLVEHIMHPRTLAPLVIIALSRPELLDRRPTWGGGRPSFTSLALRPLSGTQTDELLRRLMEGLPESARARIVERSGGNPFFAIELARGHAERVLASDGAENGGPGAPPLPDTVHAAILARVDLLAPQARAVLQAASVAARTFHPATIQAVLSGYDMKTLGAALDDLLARDLIVPADGGTYTFSHILIREVAYGTLSRAERVRMHAAVAAWLEETAAGRLDEYTELIAYHYREAVLLARQSAVPLDVPVDAERAVRYLERAGTLGSRAGAFVEAENHLRGAIALAADSDQARLYELLGDCVQPPLGETATEAYRAALERWRAMPGADPLTGARLQRKLLVGCLRWGAWMPSGEELRTLRQQARELAEAAGDEDERWRVRVAEFFWPVWRGAVTTEEADEGRQVGLAAAAHFEAKEDWSAFSEALDMYASLATSVQAYQDALEVSRRRLEAELPAAERGDALNTVARAYFNLGDYDACIATMRDALARVRPGESLMHLAFGASHAPAVMHLAYGVSRAAVAAWYTGRWDELGAFTAVLGQAWEQSRHAPQWGLVTGYLIALHMAVARQDSEAADAAAAVLERLLANGRDPESHRLYMAYREDDPRKLLDPPADAWPDTSPYPEILMFLSERDMSAPPELLEPAAAEAERERIDFPILAARIARAVASDDVAELAAAIEEAEARQMVAHAARMRVVLAQRGGDLTQLERARPVLERLGDRQFLCRMEEVAAALGAQPGVMRTQQSGGA